MSSVILDGEAVEFDGAAPQTVAQASQLIAGYLGGNGRSICSVTVDGNAVDLDVAFANEAAYERIEIQSETGEEQLARHCRDWRELCARTSGAADSLASVALRSSWGDTQRASIDLVESLRPLLEGLGILQNFGAESGAAWNDAFQESFGTAISAIDAVADALEAKDSVSVSEAMAYRLGPDWGALAKVLSGSILPTLEKGGAS